AGARPRPGRRPAHRRGPRRRARLRHGTDPAAARGRGAGRGLAPRRLAARARESVFPRGPIPPKFFASRRFRLPCHPGGWHAADPPVSGAAGCSHQPAFPGLRGRHTRVSVLAPRPRSTNASLLGGSMPARRHTLVSAAALALALPAHAQSDFIAFESGPVRPMAMSPDGTRLYVVNTPDARLEIFALGAGGIAHVGAVPVGLEPVAVAMRGNNEAWVVNHLSDSVSIVDVSASPPRVKRTLLVGDEPRDIVFAGPDRAFITTAHRGQHRSHPSLDGVPGAGDPQLTTPGVGRADVWVFDADAPGSGFGGTPLAILNLFGDTPRALAVTPDGGTVYAAVFKSGNQTTTVSEGAVCNGFHTAGPCTVDGRMMPGGLPPPSTNVEGEPAPETGLIVKYDPDTDAWRDPLGRDWSNAVLFDLPDEDVFAIDAATLTQTAVYNSVGTTLFNMAVNPVSGALYVSNTEARNEVRFEGPGIFGGSSVVGHLAESRITVVTPGGVFPRHLNKHIDYDISPAPVGTSAHSL